MKAILKQGGITMYCRRCGKENSEDSEFCRYCGNHIINIEKDSVIIADKNQVELDLNNGSECQNNSDKFNSNNHRSRKRYIMFLFLIIPIFLVIAFITKKSPIEKIAEMSKSVFLLNIYDKNHELIATGSGFLAFSDDTLITNYHVIKDAYAVEAVCEDNQIFKVSEVVNYDIEKDIVILKLEVNTKLPVLNLDASNKIEKGDDIVAIGSPLGFKNSVSNGIVSSIFKENDIESIQITAPISSGSSGGPIFNNKGKVVGITFASYEDGQNLNLAIPVNYVLNLTDIDSINVPISEFNNYLYGLLPVNTGKGHCITEYLGYLYHNYNDEYQIIKINKNTGEQTPLNIYGINVNVYDNKVFYINKDYDTVYVSDLDGNNIKDITSSILTQGKDNVFINSLFVSTYGIFFLDTNDFMDGNLYVLNEDYSLRKILYNFGILGFVQYSEDLIIGKQDDLLVTINLNDLKVNKTFNASEDVTDGFVYYYDDFLIYSKDDNNIYKLDLNTGAENIMFTTKGEVPIIQEIYKGNIYFFIRKKFFFSEGKLVAEGEMFKIDFNGNNLDKITDKSMYDINFIDDEIYFKTGPLEEKYYKCDLGGNNLKEIK